MARGENVLSGGRTVVTLKQLTLLGMAAAVAFGIGRYVTGLSGHGSSSDAETGRAR